MNTPKRRTLYLSAEGIIVQPRPQYQDVAIYFDLAQSSLGLVEGLDVAIRLSVAEARSFAQLLQSTAASVEGAASPS